jgi:mono/diheme cytochrome c family protein
MRMPSYGMSAERRNGLIAYFTALDEAAYPFAEQVQPELTPEELTAALTMFSPDYFNCTTCHIQGDQFPPGTPDRWAPDFALAAQRLRPDWIIDWLADPQSLMPGTRMPAFYPLGAPDVLGGDTDHQLEVLRDYLLTLGTP